MILKAGPLAVPQGIISDQETHFPAREEQQEAGESCLLAGSKSTLYPASLVCHLPSDGTSHSGLGPPALVNNQNNPE